MGLADRDYYGKKFWELLEGKEEISRQKKIKKPQKDSSFEGYGGEIDLKSLIASIRKPNFQAGRKFAFRNVFQVFSLIAQIILILLIIGWFVKSLIFLIFKGQ